MVSEIHDGVRGNNVLKCDRGSVGALVGALVGGVKSACHRNG